ncbi:hypothetical protein COHA_007228 [Chlorella ohadii]|uniref:Uncharacterized protein n=1 Tax=Chlorella ohadii TaxID=2649997 RepID=A0AAD5DMW6_9CHLO|nr:hypothetical protein COHA_007228 [Chlorella ohadii]
MLMLFQLLNVLNHWDHLQAEEARLYTLLVLAAAALGFASTVALPPRFYLRHRSFLVPAQRVLLVLSPSIRQTGVGTSLILEREPREGMGGALRQPLAIVIATKLAMPITQQLMVLLPPVATAAVQAVLVVLTWNPAGYCNTPMMRHPLTVGRLRRLAAALDWASLPMLAAQSVAAGPGFVVVGMREAGEDALCYAGLTFASAGLGCALPVLLSAFCYQPCPDQLEEAGGSARLRRGGALQRWVQLAKRAVRAVDWCVARTLGGRAFRLQRPLLMWWALSYTWEWSKIVANMTAQAAAAA